jgi:transcriptional regulator with XRE-family HTH domain
VTRPVALPRQEVISESFQRPCATGYYNNNRTVNPDNRIVSYYGSNRTPSVVIGARLSARMEELGLSQSELARRVGVSQSAINHLIRGTNRGSTHLHRIAREVQTTPAYLTGETDDPDLGAPPPKPEPSVQLLSMPVALPSEHALAVAFRALLSASRRLGEDELALELAKRLPTVLRIAGAALPSSVMVNYDDLIEHAADQQHDRPSEQRA